jgi:hypothetical protein
MLPCNHADFVDLLQLQQQENVMMAKAPQQNDQQQNQ